MTKKEDLNYIGKLPDNEPLPGRTVVTVNIFTESRDKSMSFAVCVEDEFTDILKKTISVEAQIEMAGKAADVVRDTILKQLGLEPH